MIPHSLIDVVYRLYDHGCPTYIDTSSSIGRSGCNICCYCDTNIERFSHKDDCLWLAVEKVARCLNTLQEPDAPLNPPAAHHAAVIDGIRIIEVPE